MKPVLVWDFDGVLNANVVDGRFVWSDGLAQDWGISPQALAAHVFAPQSIAGIMRGHVDLRDVLAAFLKAEAHEADPDAFLAYWFEKDSHLDAAVLRHLDRPGFRHVIGTNNEVRRAAFIETEMGLGARVERIFASGRIGHAKPDAAYFAHIEDWSGAPAPAHVLIDDMAANVQAAQARGWRAYHFDPATRAGLPAFLDGL